MTKNRWTYFLILAGCFLICLPGCQKDQVGTDSGLSVYSSADSVKFDQVFTTQIQPTQSVKLFNGSEQDIHINNMRLAGGETSPFKINVNGQAGTNFNTLSLAKDDSLYVFITISLPEHNSDEPFVVKDSIEYQYGDKTGKIILHAVGMNAYFLSGGTISSDTTWTDARPIVVNDNITVATTATLHINPGTDVYTRAGKSIRVNGRIRAQGTADKAHQILLTGSRLDEPYNNMPGSWLGLSFGPDSKNNILSYVHIKNAVNGIADTSKSISEFDVNNQTAVTLEGCVIMQSAKEALLFSHSNAIISNCLIYNSGIGIRAMGGKYALNYLTMTGYSNDYIYHTNPLLYLADHNGNGVGDPLTVMATNCIITGDNEPLDEIFLDNKNSDFTLVFKNSLIKATSLPPLGSFKDCLLNVDPAFISIDNRRAAYNFQLLNVSPAIGAGIPVNGISKDILNQQRSEVMPTIGCYEFKEAATN